MTTSTSPVLVDQVGHIGVLTLNRVSAHNALSAEMIALIDQALDNWESTDLPAIVLQSASPRAFCAGGDIRALRELSVAGDIDTCERVLAAEYDLNLRIDDYPIPFVTLIDGMAMGGGVGLAVHGGFVVVTERATMAMPETAIGFFPDVGASNFLSRLPGSLGMYLGLTGSTMSAADALYCGLASHFIDGTVQPSDVIGALAEADAPVDVTLRALTGNPAAVGTSTLAHHRDDIDWCFGAPSLDEIYARLHTTGTDWATETRKHLRMMSPQSLAITFDLLARGRQHGLRECLATELRVGRDVLTTPDFIEGIRAALVDKDRNPDWGVSLFAGFGADGQPNWRA